MAGLGKSDFLRGWPIGRRDTQRLLILTALCIVLLLGWVLFSPFGGVVRNYSLHRELADLQAKNGELLQQNEQLRQEMDRIANDPAYLENLARQEYGLLRENEILYRFNQKGK